MRLGAQPCRPDDDRAGWAGRRSPRCLAIRIRDGLGELFDDTQSAGLGRPALSPAQLALGSVLEVRPGAVGPPSADAGRSRFDWKCALGLELADTGVDASVLDEFRARLAADDQAERLLQRMPARLRERGLLVGAGGSAPRPARGWPRCGARTGWSWSLRRCGPRWKRWRCRSDPVAWRVAAPGYPASERRCETTS
jgi:hypothetical protein